MDRTGHAANDGDLDAIEKRSGAIRGDLADTVDELRNRLSPSAVGSDLREKASKRGMDMVANLERAAMDNPLRTAAIAAGVAYPIWNIVRNIPAPVLLVGAGVALAGRFPVGTPSTADRTLGDEADHLATKVSDAASGASATVRSVVSDAATGVSDAVTGTFDATSRKASDVVDAVAGTASDAVDAARDLAASASDRASAAYERTAEAASQAGRRSRDTLLETIDRNPFLVAGLTALAGAALAACLPVSRTENRVLGDASDRVRTKVAEAAREGVDTVRDAGGRIVSETLATAEEQGLDADSTSRTLKDVAERASSVADAAVESVLPDPSTPQPVVERTA